MSFTAENLGSEQDAWITIVNVSLAIAQILATEEVHGWLRQANQSSEALQTGREMRILSEYKTMHFWQGSLKVGQFFVDTRGGWNISRTPSSYVVQYDGITRLSIFGLSGTHCTQHD